jgi:hypothetical protein
VGDGPACRPLYHGGTVAIWWADTQQPDNPHQIACAQAPTTPGFAGQIADLWLTSDWDQSQIGIKLLDMYGAQMNRVAIYGGFQTAGVVIAGLNVNSAFSHLHQCKLQSIAGDGIHFGVVRTRAQFGTPRSRETVAGL